MKIATWNVNGIRARDAQLHEFIEREQPDVLCLQELKASLEQLPVWLCQIEGYWCYWHGGKGYSGVGLHVRKDAFPDTPAFQHPQFDYEHRIVTAQLPALTVASIYVPNGGKDFEAKMRFLDALELFAADHEASGRPLILCGDFNVARTDMDVHPKERKPNAIGQRPDERALLERVIGNGLVDVHRKMEPETSAGAWIWCSRARRSRTRLSRAPCSVSLVPATTGPSSLCSERHTPETASDRVHPFVTTHLHPAARLLPRGWSHACFLDCVRHLYRGIVRAIAGAGPAGFRHDRR
jgi:exodeoxyribonuclease III